MFAVLWVKQASSNLILHLFLKVLLLDFFNMFFSLFLTVLKFQLECNTVSCDFDGGDCQDWTSSYSNCFPTGTSKSIDCFHLFNNSRCDADCNTSGCLFDGGDCQENSVSVQFGPFVIGFQWKWKEKLEFSGALPLIVIVHFIGVMST